jgi:glycosyltransferase involved in cell wall biosynthesis
MLVWLIKDGEPVPSEPDVRPMRASMAAEGLERRGHSVVWWASNFSHQRKAMRAPPYDTTARIPPSLELRLIHAGTYQRNVSLARVRQHRRLAARFVELAMAAPRPDVIVCAMPTLDVARAALKVARARDIPLIFDIRDLWPDVFLNLVPDILRPAMRTLLRLWHRSIGRVLRGADGLIAVSPGYLEWGLRRARRARRPSDAVFHIGYDDPFRHDAATALAVSSAPTVRCLFVGSFGRSYDLTLVCDVAQRLADEGATDIAFDLVGAGEQYEEVARRAESLPNLRLHGWIGRAALVQALAAADVGLVPCTSVGDTMNNKIFEYMSAGLPIVSSLDGDTARLIAEHDIGAHYPRRDADQLHAAITRLARDSELRARQALNARRLYEARFSADVIYDHYARHIEGVVDACHRHDA